MITGELRSKVDRVRDAFRSGGIAKPLEVIEQISYLLFIRRLDDLHTLAEKKARRANTAVLVGAAAHVETSPQNLVLPDEIWRFARHDADSNPSFLKSIFATHAIRRRISQLTSGTGGSMKNISKAKLEKLELPDIDLQQQQVFARRIAAIPQPGGDGLDALFSSLQSRAFRGEL